MRDVLSDLLVANAVRDPRSIVLSGDHGYALFDAIRKERPDQFLNVGVMEQAMVGFAAGLAKTGFRPIVYGLAAFVPIRVLEQIKLDVCYSKLPVLFLGDGAGLVYSTLGSSHQCGEDIACLRPLPNIRIFTPADAYELKACFSEAIASRGPAYIRIGKSDRAAVNAVDRATTEPYFTNVSESKTCIVAMGSMTAVAHVIAKDMGLASYSVQRLKPLHDSVVEDLGKFQTLVFLEEHSRFGGLTSAVTDAFIEADQRVPRVRALTLKQQFSEKCGSYEYALSEHDLTETQVRRRITEILG